MDDAFAGTRPDPEADVSDSTMSILDDGDDRHGPLPDPRERLAGGEPIDAAELIELLCTDQVGRWRAGERIPAEAYLALHPTLRGGSEAAFELDLRRVPDSRIARRRRRSSRSSSGASPASPIGSAASSGCTTPLARRRTRTEAEPGDDAGQGQADGLAVPTVPGFEIVGILGPGRHERGVPRARRSPSIGWSRSR